MWDFLVREGLVARSVLTEPRVGGSGWLGEGPDGLCLPEAPRKLGAKVASSRVSVDGGDGMVFGRLKSRVVHPSANAHRRSS